VYRSHAVRVRARRETFSAPSRFAFRSFRTAREDAFFEDETPETRAGDAPRRRGRAARAGRTRASPRDVAFRIGGRVAFRFVRAIRRETAGNAPSAGAVRAVARATVAFAGLAAIGVAGTAAAALGADDLALELARRAGLAGTAGALSTAGGA